MSRNEMIMRLLHYGYPKESLEKMQTAELYKLFQKNSKTRITEYLEALKQTEQNEVNIEDDVSYIESVIEEVYYAISGEEVHFVCLYEALEKIFDKCDLNEALELILAQSSGKRYKQMSQITEIAFRMYQEILLSEIEKLCAFYPQQECFEQMKFYSKKRSNVAFLRHVIQTMRTPENQASLSRIAQQKFTILSDYFPDSVYENYEEYYENEEEKNEIIDRIMALTTAYRRPQLKVKKFQVLKYMEHVLLEDREREREEKALIKQYTKKIGEVIAQEDELAFGEIIKEALKVLDERDVRHIVERFDITSNPLILQRFNIIMRDNRPR